MKIPQIKMMPTIDLREVLTFLEKTHPGIKEAILGELDPVSNGCHISLDMIRQEEMEFYTPEYIVLSKWLMKHGNLKEGDWVLADISW